MAAVVLFAAGCSKKDSGAPSQTPAQTTAAPDAGPRVIDISANDAMKYDVTRIEARAGETVRVVLHNTGTLPKVAMGHNFVLFKLGANVEAFAAASATAGAVKDYFAADKVAETIAHTKLVGPKEKAEVTFKVPAEPGEYTYACTFPGHIVAGMRGVLVVK